MDNKMQPAMDEKTVLVDRHGGAPAQRALTDAPSAPRIEQLEQRMIYSARVKHASTFTVSLNPLVAAASEVLSLVVNLRHRRKNQQQLPALREQLESALQVFEAKALRAGIENRQMMQARYVLCTVVDEAVVTTGWGSESAWSQMSLLSSFHNETFGGEKVFQLLEQVSKDPVKHLSLLELIYLCLSLGFEGKFRIIARGSLELEAIRDALYRQIRHLRGDIPRELSPNWQGPSERHSRWVRRVSGWVLAVFTLGCLAVMYSGFAWVLAEQREAVLQPYQQLDAWPAVVNRDL